MKMRFFALLLTFISAQAAASVPVKYYRYAHNNAEYSVTLPEAPRVKTIWTDEGNPPYLDSAPAQGAIGEVATLRRVDIETEDSFDVKITYLQAAPAFLSSLTREKMLATLERDMSDTPLENKKHGYSEGKDKDLKWAIVSGFSVDRSNRPFYNAAHYLTGKESILVIRVRYSIENKLFSEFYRQLASNITYQPL